MMKSYRSLDGGGNVFHLLENFPDNLEELLPLLFEDDAFLVRVGHSRMGHIVPNAYPDVTYCGRKYSWLGRGLGGDPLCRTCCALLCRSRNSRLSMARVNALYDALPHPHVDYDGYVRGLYQMGETMEEEAE